MKIVHEAFPGQYAEVTDDQYAQVWKAKGYTPVTDDAAEGLMGPEEALRVASTDPATLHGAELRDFADLIGVKVGKADDDDKVRGKIVAARTEPADAGPAPAEPAK